MKWLWLPVEYVQIYGAFFLFGAGGLAWGLISMLLYPVLPRAFGAKIGQKAIQRLFRLYLWLVTKLGTFRADLSALDVLKDEKGLILAPNHPTLLDAVLVLSRMPSAVCIMKSELWDNIFLGGGARLAGYIRNDTPVDMIRKSAEALKGGAQLLVFPEGTRTRKKPVNTFKGGFALIAKQAGVPVQTIFIDAENPCLSKGWPLWKKPEMPVIYRARLGKRFEVSGDVKTFVDDLEEYFRNELGTPR